MRGLMIIALCALAPSWLRAGSATDLGPAEHPPSSCPPNPLILMRRILLVRRRPRCARLVLCSLAALVVPCASAHAALVDFESPPVAHGTHVTDAFAAQGVAFLATGRLATPRMRVGVDARSGTHALDISTGGEEFPVPGVRGEFSHTRTRVTVY